MTRRRAVFASGLSPHIFPPFFLHKLINMVTVKTNGSVLAFILPIKLGKRRNSSARRKSLLRKMTSPCPIRQPGA